MKSKISLKYTPKDAQIFLRKSKAVNTKTITSHGSYEYRKKISENSFSKTEKSLDMNEIDKDLKMYSKGKTC